MSALDPCLRCGHLRGNHTVDSGCVICACTQDPSFTSEATEPATIQGQFLEFHRRNPQVYRLLEQFTQQMADRGRTKIGIRMLWERVRWEVYMTTDDPSSEFKINDHYHSRYVRLLIAEHPEWESMFELRRLRAQ